MLHIMAFATKKNFVSYITEAVQHTKQSLSLLEMVVSLLVMSIVTSISLKYSTGMYKQYKYSVNQKKLENIQTALKNYFKIHGRLPRPSPYRNLAITDNTYGKEISTTSCNYPNCYEINNVVVYSNNKVQYSKMKAGKDATNGDKIDSTYNDWVQYTANDYMFSGIVPFKELHLTEQDIIDEYGNYIEYWVGQYMTLKIGEPIVDKTKINIASTSDTTFFGTPYKTGYNVKYFNEMAKNYYPCQQTGGSFGCSQLDDGTILPSIAITQQPPTAKLTTTDRSANNFISNENEVLYLLPPYGLRILDVATNDYIDETGTTAYVLVSHGGNGVKTCHIAEQSQNITAYNNLTSTSNADDKYEAQNCIDATTNRTINVMGRDRSSVNNTEFLFYQGEKTDFFDDQIAHSSLSKLLLDN